jgi:hypothetical protein
MIPNPITTHQIFGWLIGAVIGLVPGYYFFWPWTPGISRLNYHVRQALLALIVTLGAGTGQLAAYLLEKH